MKLDDQAEQMTRGHRIWGLMVATTIVALSSCSLWSNLQSPERAKTDSWTVWISVLKGFSGDVYYVGTKEPYAYFRIGSLFPTYYKTPACNTTLPRVFDIGSGKPYLVTLENMHGYNSSPTCDRGQMDESKAPQAKQGGG